MAGDSDGLPIWGEAETHYDITHGRPTGVCRPEEEASAEAGEASSPSPVHPPPPSVRGIEEEDGEEE
jgi:hypothetical protein